jgi:hypothetical protein
MGDKSDLPGDWIINSLGILQNNVSGSSLDDTLTINILKDTKMLDSSGNPLAEMSVLPIAPPATPPAGYHILRTFNFSPDGATFNPGMIITISYNASEVASGETVVIAYYNETASKWEFVEGTASADGKATFTATHFSTYAVMAGSEGTKAPSTTPSSGIGTTGIIGIVIGVLVLLAAGIWLALRRRTTTKA